MHALWCINDYHNADPYPPPHNIFTSSADLSSGIITFTWNPVALNCPFIQYKANTLNCGTCPSMTESTELTCFDVPSNGHTCMLTVQAFICNHTLGTPSELISIKLTNAPTTFPTGQYPYKYYASYRYCMVSFHNSHDYYYNRS